MKVILNPLAEEGLQLLTNKVSEISDIFTNYLKLDASNSPITGLLLGIVGSLIVGYKANTGTSSLLGVATVENTGGTLDFTSFNSDVSVSQVTGEFSGYAWSTDVGWVDFGTINNDLGPVSVNLTSGAVTGKAKVLDTGAYLDFTGFNSSVIVDNYTGTISGYVWSTDVGWIKFTGNGLYLVNWSPSVVSTTAKLLVNGTSDVVQSIVKASALQTNNIFEWQSGIEAVLASVSASGVITAPSFVSSEGTLVSLTRAVIHESGIITNNEEIIWI